MICLHCSVEFVEKSNKKFCSSRCQNIHGQKVWQSKHKKYCPSCNSVKIRAQSNMCSKCSKLNRFLPDMTIKESVYELHHRSSAFALIRTRARSVALKLNKSSCEKCGYNLHVEVCHIKAISEFPEDTMISVVNDPSNLIILCPNCRWEFDHPKSP